MARLYQCGFELNSLTTGVEINDITGSGAAISTSTVRSGTYSLELKKTVAGLLNAAFRFPSAKGVTFWRAFVNIATLPSADVRMMETSSNGTPRGSWIVLRTTGALALFNGAGVQIGSDSSNLSIGQWYRLELQTKRVSNGNDVIEAKINGTVFATDSTQTLSATAVDTFKLGFIDVVVTGDLFLDDIAINDSTGSFQNSYPGDGHIIHLKPSAAGDSNGFLTQTGGTAGAANNFTRVNETPPDDATSYNGSAVLNAEDLFNIDNSGIGASDTVNTVAVGVRMADLVGADATASFKVEVEKTGSGTKSQSAALIPNSTTWKTNTTTTNTSTYPLITHQDPDASNWTQSTLDSMQIGYIQTATNVQTIAISTVWASVDYTPSVVIPDPVATVTAPSTSVVQLNRVVAY